MDFFKSVFTPDLEPESSEREEVIDTATNPNHDQPTIFMGFMKILATTLESVIQTYRRNLEEFESGFKKETEAIREVVVCVIRDLPISIEAKAHSAIDALLDSSAPDANVVDDDSSSSKRSFSSNRLERLHLQLHALQSDPNTFTWEVNDDDDKQQAVQKVHKRLEHTKVWCCVREFETLQTRRRRRTVSNRMVDRISSCNSRGR